MSRDIDELTQGLARAAEAVCRRYLSHGVRRGRYWVVGDIRNTPGRSMFVRLKGTEGGKGAAGKWTDAESGDHGDLLDIIRERHGFVDFADVAHEARRFLAVPRKIPGSQRQPEFRSAPSGPADWARRLFAASSSISGTLAETYLRERGVTNLRDLGSLRFHPGCYYRADAGSQIQTLPAMIAAVTDLDGAVTGVQRTWLASSGRDKAPVETPRRAMGDLLGNAVRFGVAFDVLAAGEGIETLLSLRSVVPTLPMAAALSAAHLAAIRFPTSLRRIYIAGDNDPAGRRATARLIDRAAVAGIETIILSPRRKDFNDDIRELGVEALIASIRAQLAPEDAFRLMVSTT